MGGAAWAAAEAAGEVPSHLPAVTLQGCEASDAILFGSVGGPVDKQHELLGQKDSELN